MSVDVPSVRGLHVFVTTDAVGGVWTFTRTLVTALASHGARFTVAVLGPIAAARAAECEQLRRTPGVDLHHHDGRLEWMPDAGPDVADARRWLAARIRASRPDVVHVNGYAYASAGQDVPTCITAHSCVHSWWRAVYGRRPPPTWRTYAREVERGLRAADLVTAPSASMRDAFSAEHRCHAPVVVVHNGLAPVIGMAPKTDAVLAVGRLWDAGKNIAMLAQVADALPWPVWVAGETVAPDATTLRLPASMLRLGVCSEQEVHARMRQASIYALPARYEPFGLSVLEAASARCALVLGDIPTFRELWQDAAIFVPPDDATRWRRALVALCEDPAAVRMWAERAARRSAAYSVAAFARGYAQVYAALVDRPASALATARGDVGQPCA